MIAPVCETDRAQARRQQLLDAAAQCFRAKGFHGASMSEIARAAGMSPGHIYNLFENKEEIIGAIVACDQAQWLARITAMRQAPDVVAAMLDAIACGVEETTTLSRAALRLEVAAEASRNPKLAAVVQSADAFGREQCKALLQTAFAQRGRQLEPLVLEARARMLSVIFDGLMVRCVRDPGMDKAMLIEEVRRLVQTLVES